VLAAGEATLTEIVDMTCSSWSVRQRREVGRHRVVLGVEGKAERRRILRELAQRFGIHGAQPGEIERLQVQSKSVRGAARL
jgi:hypothetical protein